MGRIGEEKKMNACICSLSSSSTARVVPCQCAEEKEEEEN